VATSVKRYEIEDRFVVELGSTAPGLVDAWCPLIPDSPYQRVLRLAIDGPEPWTITYDADQGNRMLYCRLARPAPEDLSFQVRYAVERRSVGHRFDPGCVGPLETPSLFGRYLWAEQFVDLNSRTRELARTVLGGETNPLEQAQRIYEHVAGTMAYDAAQQSWKGSTEHALVCSVGNCNDIHALFISLCRSAGIPARLVLGQAFEPPAPGEEACEVCGYHCWAEFFASGLGWVPVDASCACKYGRGHLFGDLEMNHVAWSMGRDLLLAPPQRGGRVLFFAAPYVEVDGQPHGAVPRQIRFSEV
jgi:transglutaminase-like putative cysteine protease